MIILSGSSSEHIAEKLDDFSKGQKEIETFPDSEKYIRLLTNVEGKECALIQSAIDNNALIETYLFLDLLKDMGASKIQAVIPYLAYARQDKRFLEGEALSAKTILEIISQRSDSITVVNAHFLQEPGTHQFHGIQMQNLDATPLLARYFRKQVEDPVFIAPDKGSREIVANAAKQNDSEHDYLDKKRIDGENVEILPKNLDIENRNVVILDDMISTGGTMVEASKALKEQGAKSIHLGCVHGLFIKGTEELEEQADTLICTDTIEQEQSKVSIAPLIEKNLR